MTRPRKNSFDEKLDILDKLVKLGWGLLGSAFLLGIWVATLELRVESSVKNIEIISADSKLIAKSLNEIDLWRAATEANRFTAKNATDALSPLYDTLNNQDKRITRLENTQDSISKSLERIENHLGTAIK